MKSRSLKILEIKSSLASGKPDQLEDVISTIKNLNRSKTTLPGHRTPSTPSNFNIKMQSKHPTEVKITLSRPEKAWKKKVGNNLVGCMIGLYVYPGGVTPN